MTEDESKKTARTDVKSDDEKTDDVKTDKAGDGETPEDKAHTELVRPGKGPRPRAKVLPEDAKGGDGDKDGDKDGDDDLFNDLPV